MREIIEKQYNDLFRGLANLYIQKEQIEEQIKAQRVAIEQCKQLLSTGEEKEDV